MRDSGLEQHESAWSKHQNSPDGNKNEQRLVTCSDLQYSSSSSAAATNPLIHLTALVMPLIAFWIFDFVLF